MPPDVVYIVRPGDRNEKLRLSLRSLANLRHGRVWIAGHKPLWVRNVGHIPTRQVKAGSAKWSNALMNIRAAVGHPEVSDRFVFMNDDFYVLQPLDEVPVLHRGPLDRMIERRNKTSRYTLAMISARRVLHRAGIVDPISYDGLHVPMPMNKAVLADALDRIGSDVALFRTVYGNLAGLGGLQVGDCKVLSDRGLPGDDWLFTSVSERSLKGALGRWLRERFPDPSTYEEV